MHTTFEPGSAQKKKILTDFFPKPARAENFNFQIDITFVLMNFFCEKFTKSTVLSGVLIPIMHKKSLILDFKTFHSGKNPTVLLCLLKLYFVLLREFT